MRIAIIGNYSHSLDDPHNRELKRFVYSFTERLGKHHTIAYYGEEEDLKNASSRAILSKDEKRAYQKLAARSDAMAALSIVNKAYIRALKQIDEDGFDIVHNLSDQLAPLAASSRLKAILVTTLFKSPDKNRVNFMNENPELVESYFCAPTLGLKKSWKLAVSGLDIAHIPSGSLPAAEEIVLNLARPKNVAVWIGSIARGSGLEIAIKGCNLAGVGLHIIGELRDSSYYRKEVLPFLTSEDKYLGDPFKLNTKEIIENCRLGIWTSDFNGPLPLGVLQMLSSGLPVVGLEGPCLSSHITNGTGALVKRSEEDLAFGIYKVKDLCRVAIQQKTIHTYGANETTARYMEVFNFVKALQDENEKQKAYRHLRSSSWNRTLVKG